MGIVRDATVLREDMKTTRVLSSFIYGRLDKRKKMKARKASQQIPIISVEDGRWSARLTFETSTPNCLGSLRITEGGDENRARAAVWHLILKGATMAGN